MRKNCGTFFKFRNQELLFLPLWLSSILHKIHEDNVGILQPFRYSQVDTLRLAINYIQFLKELIETTKIDDEDGAQHKVIIKCSSSHVKLSGGTVPAAVTGHSLSWRRESETSGERIKTSRIWVPVNEEQHRETSGLAD